MEPVQSQQTTKTTDEVSVKEVLFKIRSALAYLKKKWKIMLACGIVGAGIGIAYAFLVQPKYTATCTFVLEEGGKSGGLSQYAGLASLAGIDLGAGGGGIFQGDNILELYKSRVMIEKALLSKVNNQRLIERYITFNKLREQWSKKPELANLNFNGDPAAFSRVQDSIITEIVVAINKTILNVNKPDKKLSIIKVVVQSKDELFSKLFNEQLVKEVNDFYVQTKTKKSLQSVAMLTRQKDSVRRVLDAAISGAASALDATPNANPALLILRVPSQKKQIDIQASSAVYAEITKNLELSTMSLRQETPLIQVIDVPVFPLEKDKASKKQSAIIGLLLGGLFAAGWLIISRVLNRLTA